jgi:myosin protein heavy chain
MARRKEVEQSDYERYLRYPKETGFGVSGWGEKKMVWVPHKEFGFVAAELIKEDGATTIVRTETGEEKHKTVLIHPMNPAKFEGVEDCVELTHLNEPAVFYNLNKRYQKDIIYTYSGLFCVAINPYKLIPIYTQQMIDMYRGKRRNEVAPHVFSVADGAYRQMVQNRENQSMLITGESGAGKTENTKKVIQYIAQIAGRSGGAGTLEQQLLEFNPILEAFGNAKTNKNNNSSRFGKFIRLQFNQGGLISGASLVSYLLEKSRVVTRGKGERSFHIFYQLLVGASADEKQKYVLAPPERFSYLTSSACTTVPGLNDADEFKHSNYSMDICGVTPEERSSIFRIISAILHLGNIPFVKGYGEGSEIKDKRELDIASKLLDVNSTQLDDALCKPRIKAGSEYVKTHLTVEKDCVVT